MVYANDGKLFSWNVSAGSRMPLSDQLAAFGLTAMSPGATRLACPKTDRSIEVLDLAGNDQPFLIRGLEAVPARLAWSADEQFLASGGLGGQVQVWDTRLFREPFVTARHGSALIDIAVSPDGRRLYTSSWAGYFADSPEGVRIWDLAAGGLVASLPLATDEFTRGLALSPDGRLLAAWVRNKALGSSKVTVWDARGGQLLASRPVAAASAGEPVKLTGSPGFYPDSARLLNPTPTGAEVLEARTGRLLRRVELYSEPVANHRLFLTPDGKTVLSSADYGRELLVLDGESLHLRSRIPLRSPTAEAAPGKSDNAAVPGYRADRIAVHPAGAHVALAMGYNSVPILDLRANRLVATLRGHAGRVYGVAYSPDGKRLATGSADQTIRIWDTGDNECVAILHGHTGYVGDLVFTADGKTLVSASGDGTARVWGPVTSRDRLTARGLRTQARERLEAQVRTLMRSARDPAAAAIQLGNDTSLSGYEREVALQLLLQMAMGEPAKP